MNNSMYSPQSNPDVLTPVNSVKINKQYPHGHKFALCLTHDIDDVYTPFKHLLLSSLYCIKDLKGFQQLFSRPYMNFDSIIQLENRYNAKSSFYFLATDKDPHRFRYNIEDLTDQLTHILDQDREIGLHGGYYAYNDLEAIIKEKKRLEDAIGKQVIGYRNHYLMFKVPDTWKLLRQAGFKYDTTLGYNNMVGFRNGMCHPYQPYPDILEIPLIIMDCALFNFVTTSFKQAWQITKDLIDTVEKYNGVITILWHNNSFNCPFKKDWARLYEKILAYCYEKNAWMTSADEIYSWWTSNMPNNST